MLDDEIIKIVTAHKEGHTIERQPRGTELWEVCNPNGCWNFRDYNYRIQPKEEYRPFETAQEFLDEQKKHGPYVWFSENVFNIPKTICKLDNKICFEFDTIAYQSLNADQLLKYKWQDGTVCGIKN